MSCPDNTKRGMAMLNWRPAGSTPSEWPGPARRRRPGSPGRPCGVSCMCASRTSAVMLGAPASLASALPRRNGCGGGARGGPPGQLHASAPGAPARRPKPVPPRWRGPRPSRTSSGEERTTAVGHTHGGRPNGKARSQDRPARLPRLHGSTAGSPTPLQGRGSGAKPSAGLGRVRASNHPHHRRAA